MEFLAIGIIALVYLTVVIFLLSLAFRFVNAFEKIATAIEKIANKE